MFEEVFHEANFDQIKEAQLLPIVYRLVIAFQQWSSPSTMIALEPAPYSRSPTAFQKASSLLDRIESPRQRIDFLHCFTSNESRYVSRFPRIPARA